MMSTNEIIKSIKNCPQWQMPGWNHAKFEYYTWQLPSNFEAKIIILPQATDGEIKNGFAYENKNLHVPQ